MRILFTSIRNTGHFQPLVPFIDACRRRGHEVAVAAPADLATRVAATGATFFPFGHPGDEGLRPIWERLRAVHGPEGSAIVVREIFAGACADAALPGLLETMDRFEPALVVREAQEYASVVASEKCGVARARVAISLLRLELQSFQIASQALDAHRQACGVAPDPEAHRLLDEPAFTLIPESLEFPEDQGHAGMTRLSAARRAPAPLPDHWAGRTEPLIYVTLGTVAGGMERQRGAYRVVLDAVAPLPVRALLTTGADLPLEALGEVPPNVHVERFVPQDDVLPHAAAVIGHGGSGTTIGALAAGVPMVVTPLFADQPLNAERVQATGAGLSFAPGEASPERVRAALERVLREPSFRDNAARLAAEIAALPQVDAAVGAMERLAGVRRA